MGVKSVVRAYIGPLSNYGYRTSYPVALQHVVKDIWRTRAENKDNVHYAEYLGGAILFADPALDDMDLAADVQADTLVGKWKEATPQGNEKVFLKQYDATPDLVSEAHSTAMLPEAPNFVFTLARNVSPPSTQDPATQKWELQFASTFSDAWVLEITRFGPPKLLYRTFAVGGAVASETVVSSHEVEDSERQGYAFDFYQRWEVSNLGGKLFIRSSGFREVWVVEGVGTLVSGGWDMKAWGGVYSFNVKPVTFETNGTFDTKRVEHYFLIPDDQIVVRVFGDTPTGTSITATVIESGYDAGETWKRYRITMTGTGANTPWLYGIETAAEAVYVPAGAQNWVPLNPYITSMQETISEDMATRKTTLRISLRKRGEGGLQFRDVFGNLLGEYAVKIVAGYLLENGAEVVGDRMMGILQAQDTDATPRTFTLSMTCYDRWVKLTEKKLFKAPALTGLRLDEAIAKVARWGGVAPTDIVATAIDYTVSQPKNYTGDTDVPWVPADGTPPAEVIKQLCELGAKAEYWEDGKLHIYGDDDTEVKATFSTEPGVDPAYALGSLQYTQDLAGKVNHVIAIGAESEDGLLMAGRWDYNSIFTPGTVNYKGDIATEIIINSNLNTQADVNRACVEGYGRRPAGWPTMRASSKKGYAACHLWPRQRVNIEDRTYTPINGVVTTKITQLVVSYGRGAPRIDNMTVEVVV